MNRENLGTRLSCFGSENKMAEHFTRFMAKYCLNDIIDICYLEYIWRPEQTFIS